MPEQGRRRISIAEKEEKWKRKGNEGGDPQNKEALNRAFEMDYFSVHTPDSQERSRKGAKG